MRSSASSTIASPASPARGPTPPGSRGPRASSSHRRAAPRVASGGSVGSAAPPACTAPPMVPETLVTITLDPNAAAMSPARSSARAEASVPSYPRTIVFISSSSGRTSGCTLWPPRGNASACSGTVSVSVHTRQLVRSRRRRAARSYLRAPKWPRSGPKTSKPGIALGHDLEQRVDRMRAADAQSLDLELRVTGRAPQACAARAADPLVRCSRSRRGSSAWEGSPRR